MKTGISVGDLMTRNFVHVSPKTNLKKCAETMIKKHVGSLVVKEGNQLMGILTEKDILWAIMKKSVRDLEKINAEDIANKKVITIKPSVDVIEALNRMKRDKVRRLPVTENGKVIGLLTLKDILKIDPNLYEIISETVKIKEESAKLSMGEKLKLNRKDGLCCGCGNQETIYHADGDWLCISCYNQR